MNARKSQVRGLLRAARARIESPLIGRPNGSRRRSTGLRREDVAVLAGVSLKWYSWLEQGRDLNFSEDLLDRVAQTLALPPSERAYLFDLVRRGQRRPPLQTLMSDTLRRTIQLIPVPALAMTLRWDIAAWNPLMARIARDYATVPPGERNLLRIVLTDKKYQSDRAAYDRMTRQLLREFRVDFGQCAGDPSFEALIGELHETAPEFALRWNDVELSSTQRGSVIQHDELGDLFFDRLSYIPEHSPSFRVIMLIPGEPRTTNVVEALRAELGATAPMPSILESGESNLLRHVNRHDGAHRSSGDRAAAAGRSPGVALT